MRQPVWFDADRIRGLLDYAALIDALERGLMAVETGELAEQRDSGIRDPVAGTGFLAYPAAWPAAGLATTKVLSTVRDNPSKGRPLIHAVVVAIDTNTGEMPAIFDGGQITAMRTAAISAIAADVLLGRPRGRALSIAVIGTGAQARTHVEAMAARFPLARLVLASSTDNADRLARCQAALSTAVGTARLRDAVASADIVACCTSSRTPVLRRDMIGRDTVVTTIAPFLPISGEIDRDIVGGASLVISDDPARVAERWAGEAFAFPAPAALVDHIRGNRQSPASGQRVFLSTGRPFADLVTVRLLLERAAPR